MKIGLIVGSLRKESWNRKVAKVTKDLFPEEIKVDFVEIGHIPFYNEDLDGENEISEYREIREKIKAYDGFIFFTPEYNRSFAPALKNIIDIGSKSPEGNIWAKKPVAVFSASIGAYGAMAGNLALRQNFVNVNIMPMQRPEVYLSNIQDSFDDQGNILNDTKDFIDKAVKAFIKHVELISK